MADVLFVYLREDSAHAEALAEMFEAAGYSLDGFPEDDAELRASGAAVLIATKTTSQSAVFASAARRAFQAGKAIVVRFDDVVPPAEIAAAATFDLMAWDGDPNSVVLDPLFFAVDRKVSKARDAPFAFTLLEQQEVSSGRDESAQPDFVDLYCTRRTALEPPARPAERRLELVARNDPPITQREAEAEIEADAPPPVAREPEKHKVSEAKESPQTPKVVKLPRARRRAGRRRGGLFHDLAFSTIIGVVVFAATLYVGNVLNLGDRRLSELSLISSARAEAADIGQ